MSKTLKEHVQLVPSKSGTKTVYSVDCPMSPELHAKFAPMKKGSLVNTSVCAHCDFCAWTCGDEVRCQYEDKIEAELERWSEREAKRLER